MQAPWGWLWPWSQHQLDARAQARHEALILAMGGLKGVHTHGSWGFAGGSNTNQHSPVGCLEHELRQAYGLDRLAASSSSSSSSLVDEVAGGGGRGVHGSRQGLELDVVSLGAQADVLQVVTVEDGFHGDGDEEADGALFAFDADDFDPATFFDDGSDVILPPSLPGTHPAVHSELVTDASLHAMGEPELDGCDSGDTAACVPQGVSGEAQDSASESSTPGATTASQHDDLAAPSSAAQGSTVVTVLTLYLRLHLTRQLHYLRLGMLALFTLTGTRGHAVVWLLCCFV